jgi:hypothetical protein
MRIENVPEGGMDNGKEFTCQLFDLCMGVDRGGHEFNQLRGDLGIEHRLALGFARSATKRFT